MATIPSRPNPLHGKLPPEPTKEVEMPGAGPAPNMMVPVPVDDTQLHENTMAEVEAGKKALAAHGDQLKAEIEAGQRAISRFPQPKPAPVTQPE